MRGGNQEFLFSRVMCWAAIDRAIRLARKRAFPGPVDEWRRTRDAILEDIMTGFWDPRRRTFVQHKGATTTDAALLLMPLTKFISPQDPLWLSTLAAIENDLVDDSLVYRYRPGVAAHDGLLGAEGTFCICSFWYAECLARSGDLQKARYYFEKMLGTPTTSGSTPRSSAPPGSIWATSPRRSPTSG